MGPPIRNKNQTDQDEDGVPWPLYLIFGTRNYDVFDQGLKLFCEIAHCIKNFAKIMDYILEALWPLTNFVANLGEIRRKRRF